MGQKTPAVTKVEVKKAAPVAAPFNDHPDFVIDTFCPNYRVAFAN